MTGPDAVAMVDWSGGNDRGLRPKKDAIWIAVHRGEQRPGVYHRNRAQAEAALGELIEGELSAGRRLLVGFDFPFAYPAGFARALIGTDDPLALWDWLEARIEDAPRANNRFDVAGGINLMFGGRGPFWANALRRDIDGLARTRAGYATPFPERRACEVQARGAFTCWQLAGAGAVGSQVLMGLPVMARLRRRFAGRVAVWPFEPLDRPVAFVEVWPSLLREAVAAEERPGDIRDEVQVRVLARAIAALPRDRLAAMLDVRAPVEGWIFGLGFEAELDRAARRTAPRAPLRRR